MSKWPNGNGNSKRPRFVEDKAWVPPLSFPTLLGIALFVVYVGSAIYSTLPLRRGLGGGVAALYTRADELEYCRQPPPPSDSCFAAPESNRTIYMQPYGGLGNRLRAVASALTIAKEVNANVVIVWMEKEHGFRGRWGDLFAEPRIPLGCFPGQAIREDHAKCRVHKINHYTEWEAIKHKKWQRVGAAGQEVLCLQSMMFLTAKQRGIAWLYELLRPTDAILEAVETFKRSVNWGQWGQWIGVHIRRTDLRLKCNTDDCHDGLKASDVLSLASYTNILTKVAELSANVDRPRFYLATDDPATEEAVRLVLRQTSPNLTEETGGVVSYTKAVRDSSANSLAMRNSAAGMAEAVVDLWLLGSVRLLVGTVGSSYSQTAKLMGSPFFISVGVEYENKL